MNNHHAPTPTSSVCFVGSSGLLSLTAFNVLRAQGVRISRIILAGHPPAPPPATLLPVTSTTPDAIPQQARQLHTPIHYVGAASTQPTLWQDIVRHTAPDMLFVACFPVRLPDNILHWPKRYALNLHPSLLPDYRGPDPLFWQLRHAETHTGISLHQLTAELDAGPIVQQQNLSFPTGATRHELDRLVASQGSEMFARLVDTTTINATQQPQRGRYFPAPTADDYSLNPAWSALQAFNFMRGTHSPTQGYPLSVDGTTLHLTEAISFDPDAVLPTAYVTNGETIHISFSPGVLQAKYL